MTFQSLARVRVHDQWGFVDVNGAFVIEPRFREANDFREGLAVVLVDGWVYVDKSGKVAFQSEGFDAAMRAFPKGSPPRERERPWFRGALDRTLSNRG